MTANAGNGRELLLGALQVWLTKHHRVHAGLLRWSTRLPVSDVPAQPADFVFTQETLAPDDELVRWMPRFVDYMFLSITNSTAFSPTDTLPLTTREAADVGAGPHPRWCCRCS